MVAMVLRLAYARDAQITPRDVDEYYAPTQFPSYVQAMRDLLHDFEWSAGRREDLERVAAPTLVLYGTRDLLVWRPSVEALVRSIPQVRFEVVEGAGHVLPEEVPALVNARLAEFVGAGEQGRAFVAAGGTTS
jgi:pimeloyl-ACP methyl ester carboxylesterase